MLVRAHAFAKLQVLSAEERGDWATRADALGRELGVRSPAPTPHTAEAFLWGLAMRPLEELHPALQQGPRWLVERHADEEHRQLLVLAEAIVTVLQAFVDQGSHPAPAQRGLAVNRVTRHQTPPKRHDMDAVLAAYVDHVAVGHDPCSDGWYRTYEPYYAHVLSAYSKAFGVSFDEDDVPPEKRDDLLALKRVVRQEVELPFPGKGALDISLLLSRWPSHFEALHDTVRQVKGFYRGVARWAATRVWGDLGVRTEAQLAAAGLGRMTYPSYDYDDV